MLNNEFENILFMSVDLLKNHKLDEEAISNVEEIIDDICDLIVKDTYLYDEDVLKVVRLLKDGWIGVNTLAEYKYNMIDKDKLDVIRYNVMWDEMDKKWEQLKELNNLRRTLFNSDTSIDFINKCGGICC